MKVGDQVKIKKDFRKDYDGATGGKVLQLTTAGVAVKVQLVGGTPPNQRWVSVQHLEPQV